MTTALGAAGLQGLRIKYPEHVICNDMITELGISWKVKPPHWVSASQRAAATAGSSQAESPGRSNLGCVVSPNIIGVLCANLPGGMRPAVKGEKAGQANSAASSSRSISLQQLW